MWIPHFLIMYVECTDPSTGQNRLHMSSMLNSRLTFLRFDLSAQVDIFLFIHHEQGHITYLLLYVDDIILIGPALDFTSKVHKSTQSTVHQKILAL